MTTPSPQSVQLLPDIRGKFITLEGIDGCGKTTQAKALISRIEELGYKALLTKEPGGTEIGTALRQILLDSRFTGMVPECELLLFLADRVQHLSQIIRPALERGEVVVCDRFHDATIAYQHFGRELDVQFLGPLADALVRPKPHWTILLDIDVDEAISRTLPRHGEVVEGIRRKTENVDRPIETTDGDAAASHPIVQLHFPFEQIDGSGSRLDLEYRAFHQRVRRGYLEIARNEPIRVESVDASGTVEAIHNEIWTRLTRRFRV